MRNQTDSASTTAHRHIALFGKQGSGKSSLFQALIRRDHIVHTSGGNGPTVGECLLGGIAGSVALIDTAGLSDTAELNSPDMLHMRNILHRADIAVYVADVCDFDRPAYTRATRWLDAHHIDHVLVFNKCDLAYAGDIAHLKAEFPEAIFLSATTSGSPALLRARLSQMVSELIDAEPPLVGNLIQPMDIVVMSLPENAGGAVRNQEQLNREFIAGGARVVLVRESDLARTILELPHVDLVLAYARNFSTLREEVPEEVPITSYSLLYGRQRGDLEAFIEAARGVSDLTADSRVLIAEGCPHGELHQDIGRVKIPRDLRRLTGEGLHIDYCMGADFPDDVSSYDLIIHCAGCSMTRRTMQSRIAICQDAGVPISNFGAVLAFLSGILDRCTQPLKEKAQ
ncbi:MAG: GTP-binding protein [Butyricicoccaceae bacterium]